MELVAKVGRSSDHHGVHLVDGLGARRMAERVRVVDRSTLLLAPSGVTMRDSALAKGRSWAIAWGAVLRNLSVANLKSAPVASKTPHPRG